MPTLPIWLLKWQSNAMLSHQLATLSFADVYTIMIIIVVEWRAIADVVCSDIDECLDPGSCSQICDNTDGSYRCRCHSGYFLEEDSRLCRAAGRFPLPFSTVKRFAVFHLNTPNTVETAEQCGAKWATTDTVTTDVYFGGKTSLLYGVDCIAASYVPSQERRRYFGFRQKCGVTFCSVWGLWCEFPLGRWVSFSCMPALALTYLCVSQHCTSAKHTHIQVFYGPLGFCPGLPRWASTRKVKPIWIYCSKR